MATYHLDPITRIEGHLAAEVTSTTTYTGDAQLVTDCKMSGEMYRGIENILHGRAPSDAIEIVQRICGVCPVPHGFTANKAVEDAITATPTGGDPNTVSRLVRNMVLGSEFLMSHITHFYHLSALSFVQGPNMPPWTPYFHDDYYASVLRRQGGRNAPDAAKLGPTYAAGVDGIWDTVVVDYIEALKWRRLTLQAGAIFAGRMPLVRSYVTGGVTCRPTSDDVTNFKNIIGSLASSSATQALSGGAAAAQAVVPVAATANFYVGQRVRVSEAAKTSTYSMVASLVTNTSITLADNCADTYTVAGTVTVMISELDGAAAAAQAVVPVADTTGFFVGQQVSVTEAAKTSTYSSVASIAAGVSITLADNCADNYTVAAVVKTIDYVASSGIMRFIRFHYIPLTHIVSYLYGAQGGTGTEAAIQKYDNDGTNPKSGYGSACNGFLSYGGLNLDNTGGTDPNRLFKRGYMTYTGTGAPTLSDGTAIAAMESKVSEFIYNSHYVSTTDTQLATAMAPSTGYTNPKFANGYSWLKSPRIETSTGVYTPMQVGPLARMAVHGERQTTLTAWEAAATTGAYQGFNKISLFEAGYKLGTSKANRAADHYRLVAPIVTNLAAVEGLYGTLPGTFLCGTSTMDRHRSRAHEALKIAKALLKWADELDALMVSGSLPTAEVSYSDWTMPTGTVSGYGMEEAPRGSLGHWITVTDGVIANYQAVVPTTWNCSPAHNAAARDKTNMGPCEWANVGDNTNGDSRVTLAGIKSGTENAIVPVEVLRITQSFDPCLGCAIHVIEPEAKDLEGRCS